MERIISFFKKDNFLYTKIGVWLLLIYFPIFLNLGGFYMFRWDESRYAASSYEMIHGNSNPFVVTFLNAPSNDSPKPPLFHWIQALFITLFGFNEQAVRLPSAISGFIICLAIMYFSIKKFKSFSLGAIATLILITTQDGFCGTDHCVRTGDYDAMLAMFSLLGIFYFYNYSDQPEKPKYLFLTFFFFTLAVLTKGASGLFYAPGLIIYSLARGNFLNLLKSKWLYISLAMFIAVVGFVLLIREHYSPGYLKALNEMELFGRHNTVKDGHEGDFWFYLTYLKERFNYFFLFIPFGWLVGLSLKDDKMRNLSLFTFISIVSYYVVISTAQSKLQWYSFPLFPLMALQAGMLVWVLLKCIVSYVTSKIPANKVTMYYLSITLIFCVPYLEAAGNSYNRDVPDWFKNYNNVQEYLKYEEPLIKNAILVATHNDTQGPYIFYYYKLTEKGFNLKYQLGYNENYNPGDKLIVEDPAIQEVIEKNFNTNLLYQFRHLKVYLVISKKA